MFMSNIKKKIKDNFFNPFIYGLTFPLTLNYVQDKNTLYRYDHEDNHGFVDWKDFFNGHFDIDYNSNFSWYFDSDDLLSLVYYDFEYFWFKTVIDFKYMFFLYLPEITLVLLLVLVILYISWNNKNTAKSAKLVQKYLTFTFLIVSLTILWTIDLLLKLNYKNFYVLNPDAWKVANNIDQSVFDIDPSYFVHFYNADSTIYELFEYFDNTVGFQIFNNFLIIDFYSQFMKLFLCFSTFLLFFCMKFRYFNEILYITNLKIRENMHFFYLYFYIFSSFVVFFLMNLISSYDLLSFFVSLEGATLILYTLAGLQKKNKLSVEGGLKYFLISATFSCLFGFACFGLYYLFGSTNFYYLRENILHLMTLGLQDFISSELFTNLEFYKYLLMYFFIFIICSMFLVKLGSAPFYYWIGDVYQGSSLAVTIFFATVVRIGLFAAFFRLVIFVFFFLSLSNIFSYFLYFFSFCSIFVGAFIALAQTDLKRFFAYSSIVHTGFILLGLSTMTLEGFKASLFYLIVYIIVLLGFFLVILVFPVKEKLQNGLYMVKTINYFSDLKLLNFFSQMLIIFFLFSMAGFPPLPGFLMKLYIFKSFIFSFLEYNFYSYFNIIIIFLFIIIFWLSLLTAYNYIRIISKMFFFKKEVKNIGFLKSNDFLMFFKRDQLIIVSFFTLLIFFYFFLMLQSGKYIYGYFNSNVFTILMNSLKHPFFNDNLIQIYMCDIFYNDCLFYDNPQKFVIDHYYAFTEDYFYKIAYDVQDNWVNWVLYWTGPYLGDFSTLNWERPYRVGGEVLEFKLNSFERINGRGVRVI